jgi:hypothetical protein
MTAGLYNFTCTKGSALNIVITLKNPDQTKPNIQNWTSRMQIRSTVESSSTMMELTTENGRLVNNVDNGTITVALTSSETNTFTSSGVYDLELVEPNSNTILRIVQGNFNLVTS